VAAQVASSLAKLQTVEGRLEITTGGVVLQQELWVERPNALRTETEEGPAEFKGTIVVLNAKEGWLYNPAVNLVTLVDRTQVTTQLANSSGAGSMLERLPTDIQALLEAKPDIHQVGSEVIAGRTVNHWEIVNNGQSSAFPTGLVKVWLDDTYFYPLAVTLSSGLSIRFTSVDFNQSIDPLTFTFVPPPGVRVQKVEAKP
jgi:outer membrane lipoprotein-sorting protein